jgi:periplasmic protein TonB
MKFGKIALACILAGGLFAGNIAAQDVNKVTVTDVETLDKAPAFKGGQTELVSYIKKNAVYPEACRMVNSKAVIKVGFTVSETGAITDVKYVGHPELDNRLSKEGVRVVSAMPTWEPATKSGQKVATKVVVDIDFHP